MTDDHQSLILAIEPITGFFFNRPRAAPNIAIVYEAIDGNFVLDSAVKPSTRAVSLYQIDTARHNLILDLHDAYSTSENGLFFHVPIRIRYHVTDPVEVARTRSGSGEEVIKQYIMSNLKTLNGRFRPQDWDLARLALEESMSVTAVLRGISIDIVYTYVFPSSEARRWLAEQEVASLVAVWGKKPVKQPECVDLDAVFTRFESFGSGLQTDQSGPNEKAIRANNGEIVLEHRIGRADLEHYYYNSEGRGVGHYAGPPLYPETIVWLLSAIGSGIIGNAAYDTTKKLLKKVRRSHEDFIITVPDVTPSSGRAMDLMTERYARPPIDLHKMLLEIAAQVIEVHNEVMPKKITVSWDDVEIHLMKRGIWTIRMKSLADSRKVEIAVDLSLGSLAEGLPVRICDY